MTLLARVTRLFQADFHAVLDRIEEPEPLLKQAVREMEEELAREQEHARLLRRRRELLESRRAEAQAGLGDIEEQLNVCFDAGNDGLARKLIRRRLETEHFMRALQRGGQELDGDLAVIESRLEKNRARLEETKNRAALLAADAGSKRPEDAWPVQCAPVSEADVEVAFLRERRRRGQP